jgi:hypothetical protein
VITNPHVNLREPYNLNRPDGDYVSGTWCRSFDLPHLTSHLTSPHLTSPHPSVKSVWHSAHSSLTPPSPCWSKSSSAT